MFSDLTERLHIREQQGLKRHRAVTEGPQSTHVVIDDRVYLSFCSNDYLGLANHPELIQAACQGAQHYGVGAGASHLINGHSVAHHTLERALAKFTGFPAALLFSTGYMANMGVITALAGRNDVIFADKLNHASLNEAALLSRAKLIRYPHCDTVALERRLAASGSGGKLVITDAVFSMDGDIAPIRPLIRLCEQYDAMLLLDDAHGFGVLGGKGRGTLFSPAAETRHSPRVIYMATLGKAAGVFGAFVAAADEVIETLIQTAKSYIYTTASPPLLAHTLLKSLERIENDSWRRDKLYQLIELLKAKLQPLKWRLMPSDTPIQPLVIGEAREAVHVSNALKEKGILVPAIRQPTVPRGTARLRISLSVAHEEADILRLADELHEIAAGDDVYG
ncbi:MAG: 8-amino-7-oxononanoate synthase [Nitrosomonas sp.]|nr:8-amino-7-oxononanoate synthase [Nitrosomonas sp.]